MLIRNGRLALLVAGLSAAFGCTPLGDEKQEEGAGNTEAYVAVLDEGAEAERPERLADWVPPPVIGRARARPIRVEPIPDAEFSLAECIEYMLPDWDVEVVLTHPADPEPDLTEAKPVRFRGGSLDAFLRFLSLRWDVDVSSPYVGRIQVASRGLESWLVTHWMEPPLGTSGSATPGIQQPAQQQPAQQGQQGGGLGGGFGGVSGSLGAELVAEVGESLELLLRRLRDLAGDADEQSEQSVWVNAEAGLLHIWASPVARRAMRPLLLEYGAQPLAADRELLAMMTRGQFRLRLMLVRMALSQDRNIGVQWEEGLEAVFPAGRSLLGVPDVGFGSVAREDRLTQTGQFVFGEGGISLGASAGLERGQPTFPFGSRWALASDRARHAALQQVVDLERGRATADLGRIDTRISELESRSAAAGTGEASFTDAQARELRVLRAKRDALALEIDDLTRELGLAALRTMEADEWLNRVTESNERDWRRSFNLIMSLGSAHGETKVVHNIAIDARHGRPVTMRVGSERTFIPGITQTISQTFSTSAATTETRLEGLDLVVRPWLEGRRCVRVGLQLNNSGITSVASFIVAGTELAIPQMAVQEWASERRLCDSRPAVLARFKLETSVSGRSGVPVFGERQVPTSTNQQIGSEEYLLLLQVLLPPEWGPQ